MKRLSVKRLGYDRSMSESTLPGPLPDELSTLWYLIRRIGSLMDRESEALFRRELGVSMAQFLVLSVVDAHPGPLSQQAIADRVGLTKGTVSRQIDHAVSAGLMTVRVAEQTRRENAVSLTEAGTALVRKGDALSRPLRDGMLEGADPAQVTATIGLLRGLLAALES
jgi:DNA-binding MarR family transcriptional regulator